MSALILETLRVANRNLHARIAHMQPGSSSFSGIGPEDFADVLEQVRSANECLRRVSAPDAAQQKEITEFRGSLEQLVKIMPAIKGWLLAEKARLESKRIHLDAAASWIGSAKNTL